MSDIVITRKHTLGLHKARVAAERVAADLRARFALDYAWSDSNSLVFGRPGVACQLALARREVALTVQLGLFYRPFRAVLEDKIHAYFDREFTG
ncbi:polyhydroxyalkanoic acid system family protein [Dechloromonas sp.]|uniref:polyhydroxyalkanoic acid system family protein n=1 Tax=Dechloromonas sp. TaxID=1917218 RepID=UPI0011FA6233|nr:polyhydroxyalkanoic acid system family protein [Dechloromonas sp.]MBU3697584.1 poly(3-hydroxybutyrate) depolymerase [Dechloromonas sp.]TEX48130.1 MAG: poly(3-hydroxybutyrate) depolymerase [Rhodocyclaceae bacterium]